MAAPLKKLNERHLAFIDYLIQTQGNKTEAARRAGFSAETARFKGSELYADPLIAAEYKERLQERRQAAAVTTEAVIAEIAAIAFGNIDDVVTWQGRKQIPNPHYLTPDQHKERDIERQTQEALGHTPEPIDPFINTRDKYVTQPESVTLKDSDELSRVVKSGIGNVTLTPTKFGDKLSISMGNKLDALGKLVNILGINQPKRIEVQTQVEATTFGIKKRAAPEPVAIPDTQPQEPSKQ
jgi:hypothetical protein